MLIDHSQSLATLVLERPASIRVLERLGLDYCCGGRRTLAEACAEHGLDAATVAVFLEREAEPVATEPADWAAAPLADLCAHIVEVHHGRLRWELPRLSDLAERAADAHGEALPALLGIRDELARLREEVEQHIAEEERDLFPALAGGETLAPDEPKRLRTEHNTTGARLHRLRELANNYDTGTALCNTHRALLQGLHGLELDLHQHVHEENNILFPRALAPSRTSPGFRAAVPAVEVVDEAVGVGTDRQRRRDEEEGAEGAHAVPPGTAVDVVRHVASHRQHRAGR